MTRDFAHGRLALKGVDCQAVCHHLPVLKELLEYMNPAVLVARTQIHRQNMFDVIVTVVWEYILEAEDRMPVGKEVSNKKRDSLEELQGGAGCEGRFVDRMPQQRVNKLLRRLTKAPE